MRTVVHCGPTVSATAAATLLPGAVVAPPVRHGDLLRLDVGPGDRVVIIDGVFHQSAAVRHKEIGALLAAGVQVWGVSSMGALRAAELGPHGMRGAGTVHRLYSLGVLDRDDEVALVHTEPDHGSRALTVALVSVRALARRLARTRRIPPDADAALVAAADALPFPDRTWAALLEEAQLPAPVRDTVTAAVRRPAVEWDVKARDAVRLLRGLAATTAVAPRTPPPPLPWTAHLERWHRAAHPGDDRLVTAAALYAVDYPDLYRDTVLDLIGGPRAVTDRGLVPRGSDPDRVLGELVAGYRWAGGLPPTPALAVAVAVAVAAGGAALHAVVAAADHLNQQLVARGRDLAAASRSALLGALGTRWATDDLEAAAARRGYRDLDELCAQARWFTPQLLLDPPPEITLQEPNPRRAS